MRTKKLTEQEINELRQYVKEQSKKLKKEGSTTAGVPGYQTPAAFTGNEGGEGAESFDYEDDQFAYSEKAPKTHKHSVKLHEVSYKAFKQDNTVSEIQKVNKKILEVNKMLREISRSLDHSIKLKQESALDNSVYWKRTNEAILKINNRLAEVSKKARKLANLKELAASNVKAKLEQFFKKAGIQVASQDIEYNQVGTEHYEFDIYIGGEPYAIDYQNGELTFQDYDQEVVLGNINQEADLIKNIAQTFKQ
jgi:galactitol-specific phosphotransferase system IIB component